VDDLGWVAVLPQISGDDLILREKDMRSRTVSSKSELREARESGVEEIIVTGRLADQLHTANKVTKVSAMTLVVLTTALLALPFSGGATVAAVAPIATLTGIDIAVIISASAIGLALVLAVYRGYDEIEYENGRLTLRRKRVGV
jgi:NADH:ubiquinone oxidoreductase subunit K